ncbi:MAG: M20/M25/M40 family metallo-hydrolase [Candidatus Eisenbacteria bacterium]|uniref:M20/M25/M40 family metallo-hydrolase n=1 Tax=Eiseniibacteriota bacterium TaxID=2212470 RepID=A0A7Y2EB34_UNCEI|nr:M20/M25/M40 family metallo-hydrolase [Candidatus Eisenbacteria bacterium]
MRQFKALLILSVFAATAFLAIQPVPSQTTSSVSADSILATVADLTGESGFGPPSRFAPLPETALYPQYLKDKLDRLLEPLGGSAELVAFDPEFEVLVGDSIRNPYTNVFASVPGKLADQKPGFFMLGAHLDATAQRDEEFEANFRTHPAPGADDNASGVAVVAEVARVMAAENLRPDANLVFTFFDGEEQQVPETDKFLLGSRVMAERDLSTLEEEFGPLLGFVNLDMVAYNPRQDSLVVVTNIPSRWLANQLIEVYEELGLPNFMMTRAVEALTFSDHGPFWEVGKSAVLIIENPSIQRHAPHYHKQTDTIANTFLRGGSQAQRAGEVVLELVRRWSQSGTTSGLHVTGESILIQKGNRVDAVEFETGDEAVVRVGVTNRGPTRTEPWSVEVDIKVDGVTAETLGMRQGRTPLPAGAAEFLEFPWTVSAAARGGPSIEVKVRAANNDGELETQRVVAVGNPGAELLRAYVYPNPTRFAEGARLHYELTEPGAVRLILMDISGRELGVKDIPFDRVFPDPGTAVGAADLPLADLFSVQDLAPGLYLIRIEQFQDSGSVGIAFARWALLK